jgi:hypothetical protein
MNDNLYFLIEDHDVTGPHSLTVLRQKAEIFAITPDTPVKPSEPVDALWMHIHEMPALRATLFPQKKSLNLQTLAPFPGLTPTEAGHEPVHIEEILRENAMRQIHAENFDISERPKGPRYRRNRNFILIAVTLNLTGFVLYCLTTSETPFMVMAPTVTAFATVLIYWFMYHLVDTR